MAEYSERFYRAQSRGSRSSAMATMAYLKQLNLVHWSSILDVGCGRGHWLGALSKAGATHLVGIDGGWNSSHFESLPTVRFIPFELETLATSRPPLTDESFDLAICLETAEHLSPAAGVALIDLLVNSAAMVLFSAAVPGQGGTGHRNEQWPSYWARRFQAHGLEPYDLLRPLIWDDHRIDYWYRQNLIIFARSGILEAHRPSLVASLDLVHPALLAARRAEPLRGDWARGTVRVARRMIASAQRRLWS